MISSELFLAFTVEMEKIALTAEKKARIAKEQLGVEVTEGDWRKAAVLAKKGKLTREALAHPSRAFIDHANTAAPSGREHAEVWTPGGARHQVAGQHLHVELPVRNRHGYGGFRPTAESTHDIRETAHTVREKRVQLGRIDRKTQSASFHQERARIAGSKGEDAAKSYTKLQSQREMKANRAATDPGNTPRQTVHSHPYSTDSRTELFPHIHQDAKTHGMRTRFPGTIPSVADVHMGITKTTANRFHGIYDPVEKVVGHHRLGGTTGNLRVMRVLSKVK